MIDLTIADHVATLTMQRASQRNALSLDLMQQMLDALSRGASNNDVRVLILRGEGHAFCAGLDLDELTGGRDTVFALLRRLGELAMAIRRLPIPSIAVVQGAAIAGGCALMLACDFAVTHTEAKIGYPPLGMNLSPALLAPYLVRKVGAGRARALLLHGGTVSGARAEAIGMASHLADREALDSRAVELAAHLLTGDPAAAWAMKSLLNDLDGSMDDAMLQRAAEVSAEVMASEAAQRKLAALRKGDRPARRSH
jgi:methylglutaconyl-CoA hydratase